MVIVDVVAAAVMFDDMVEELAVTQRGNQPSRDLLRVGNMSRVTAMFFFWFPLLFIMLMFILDPQHLLQ